MSEDLAFAVERSFLAQEFLTWLWFKCEVEGGEFELADSSGAAVVIEDALSLTSWDEDGTKASIRGGNPTLRPEAASALKAGLTLRKARLIAAKGDREWHFSLDGETLDLLSVKVPALPEGDDAEDPLAEKLAAGEELRDLVDQLFGQFLGLRLASDWDAIEVPRMKSWGNDKMTLAWN
jgi:hypothetical protein